LIMKVFKCEDREVQIPDIKPITLETGLAFEIQEGDCKGIQFTLTNIRIDDKDDTLLWYDLNTVDESHIARIQSIVDNYILMMLYEGIKSADTEGSQTVEIKGIENEDGQTSNSDS